MTALTPITRRLIEASSEVLGPPDQISFIHSVLAQVGLPRRKPEGESFDRTSGQVSLRITSGDLWNGRTWQKQPLPYGTRPRLALVHISSEAVRTRNHVVDVGDSTREFLLRLGIDTGGKEYAGFKKQMSALAACEMRLGIGASTLRVQPVEEFAAWLHPTGKQQTLWPGQVTLSQRFFESLVEAAVPLDPRALKALSHTALGLDVYTWLAHRLCRVKTIKGDRVSWVALKEQFGHEYAELKDFRREMLKALGAVKAVYPDAGLEQTHGGLLLKPSKPPIPKIAVSKPRG